MYRMSIYAKLHEVRIRIGFKFSSSTLLVTQCIRARQLGTAGKKSPNIYISIYRIPKCIG